MAQPDPPAPRAVNPYLVPADQQGWRGISVPGQSKRKWYTLLHNEQVLVLMNDAPRAAHQNCHAPL